MHLGAEIPPTTSSNMRQTVALDLIVTGRRVLSVR
jgi:hypothetical protein